jgi:hypothetical protein
LYCAPVTFTLFIAPPLGWLFGRSPAPLHDKDKLSPPPHSTARIRHGRPIAQGTVQAATRAKSPTKLWIGLCASSPQARKPATRWRFLRPLKE